MATRSQLEKIEKRLRKKTDKDNGVYVVIRKQGKYYCGERELTEQEMCEINKDEKNRLIIAMDNGHYPPHK